MGWKSQRSMVLVALVTLAVASGVGVPSALGTSDADGKYGRAQALEREGKFAEANELLRPIADRLGPGKREHAFALQATLRALAAGAVYQENDQLDEAELTLKAALKKLDPVRDVYLTSNVAKRIAFLTTAEHPGADSEARASLARANSLEKDGKYHEAAAAFASVVSAADTGVAAPLLQKARLGKLRAQREDANAQDSRPLEDEVGDWLAGKGRGIADWVDKLLPLLLVFAAIWFLLLVRRRRRPEEGQTTINLTDWSADRSERRQKSLALGRQLKAEIDAVGRPSTSGTEVDETRDLDGSAVPGLRPGGDEIEGLDAVIPDDSSIKIGPVSFGIAQLLNGLRTLFRRRPERQLVGSLTADDGRTIIAVELLKAGTKEPEHRWLANGEGTNARGLALAELATKIAVQIGQPYVSRDWRSVSKYREALAKLASQNQEPAAKRLADARSLLQHALENDPHNLLARFYLATVERASGRNLQSIKQLDFLETMVDADKQVANGQSPFLQRHSEFRPLIEYNKAVALAKLDDWACHKQALDILSALRKTVGEGADEAAPHESRRLLMLVRSAEASALVFELEEWRALPQDKRRNKRRTETLEQIREARDEFHGTAPDAAPRQSVAYVQARATVENAYGRALDLTNGNVDDAVGALWDAVSLTPDFTDAWLNLAAVLIERERGADWAARAEDALDHAFEIAPDSPKGHWLRGELCEKTAQYDEAKAEFAKVPGDYRAAMKLAQLAKRAGESETAAKEMARSLKLRESFDFRAVLYVEYLLDEYRREGSNKDQSVLDEAENWAKKLVAKGEREGTRRRGEELLGEIADARR
jgi:cytochrome c-type biogenesis protein CcmH/NrfG